MAMMTLQRTRWFGLAFCIMGISSWGTSDGFCSGFTSWSMLLSAPSEKRIPSSRQNVLGFGNKRRMAVAGRREPGDDPVEFSESDYERQLHETVKALAETHAGVWTGKATSWSVDAHDVARGVIRRKYDVPYTTHVTLTSAQDLEFTLDTHREDLDSKLFSSQTHVASDRLLQQLSRSNNNRRKDEATECCIVETFSFEDKRKQQRNIPKEEEEASNGDSSSSLFMSRHTWCNNLNDQADVDSVDGSFSLEWSSDCVASETKEGTLPKSLFGIMNAVQVESVLQHCTVLSDTERVRTFLVYNDRQELDRIVVCEEQREASSSSSSLYKQNKNNAQDDDRGMNEEDMEGTADRIINKLFGDTIPTPTTDKIETTKNGRAGIQISLDKKNDPSIIDVRTREEESTSQKETDRLKQLSAALSGAAQPSDNNDGPVVERLVMTLMDLSNGIWLGDSVIRNRANVPSEPSDDSMSSQKGFGKRSFDSNNERAGFQTETEEKTKNSGGLFGRWMTGVQKVAFRVGWNFGETVRSTFTFGKALGVTTVEQMPTGSIGRLVLDESMQRRIPKHQRMTYIDFDMGLTAGFVLGSVYIRAPKNLVFNPQSNRSLPFVTEVCIFQQSDVVDDNDETQKCETSCHKLTRIYNHEGRLKQGISSFFSLQPLPDRD